MRILFGRESDYVGEVRVQCKKDSTVPDCKRRICARGSRPKTTSLVREDDLVGGQPGGIFETSLDVLGLELRIGGENVLTGFSGRELLKNEVDRNTGPFEARLAHHYIFSRLDVFWEFHDLNCIKDGG